jgi:hypothetical protein
MKKNTYGWMAGVGFMAAAALAAEPAPGPGADESPAFTTNAPAWVAAWNAAQARWGEGCAGRLVLPGVAADRAAKIVRVIAETTEVKPGDTVEFFMAGEGGGHGYESLLSAHARAGDVDKALQFIGLPPGRGVDMEKWCFWPRGERVMMRVAALSEASIPSTNRIAVEDLVYDAERKQTLPRLGLVYTGSIPVTNREGRAVLAADVDGLRSIAANYNESQSLLDVPRQAPQREVYGNQVADEQVARSFAPHQPVEVSMEPEYRDGRQRVCAARLEVDCPAADAAQVQFRLQHKDHPAEKLARMEDVVRRLAEWVTQGYDPFVTVAWGARLTVGQIRDICRVLHAAEGEPGIRVEPPEAGSLYYRAFIPPARFKDRQSRVFQPFELKLSISTDREVTGELTWIEKTWPDDAVEATLTPHTETVKTPLELRAALDRHLDGLPVILVFAPADLPHGQMMTFLRPARATHPTIHVFVEDGTPEKKPVQ